MPDTPLMRELLQANERYATTFKGMALPPHPGHRIAVLTCMDSRVNVEEILGLRTGDAHVIRNAGGIATDDALRSLIVSAELLGTKEFVVVNHTECGMTTFKDWELQDRLLRRTGVSAWKLKFHTFDNLEDNLRAQVNRIRANEFVPEDVPISGLVCDVRTGRLKRVV